MPKPKKRKLRETKGEKAIRKKRERDFALNYGAFGYPFTPNPGTTP